LLLTIEGGGAPMLMLVILRTLAILAVGALIFWLRRYMTGR